MTNTAFATGTQNGSEVRSTNTTATVEYAHLTLLEKKANTTSYFRINQNIEYNYTVKNDGHVNLTGPVNITDDHINSGLPFSITDGLNVSESKSNTTNYPINQTDIDRGYITNSAFATGSYSNISINSSNKAVTILYSPLTLEKTPSPTAYSAAGQNITYSYKVIK